MRSVGLFILFLLLCLFSKAQSLSYANQLFEYRPAPGQFINNPVTGSPSAALDIINQIGNPLSLGAFGGYVVLGFNSPIVNDPDNPYGVDFIIYGNASATHAEPGIVMVMKDENKNGIPDDTWYEIAGSAHFTDEYTSDYSITYLNPKQPSAADVPWTDNSGNSGKISKNSFHTQPYYPLNSFFPGISSENMSFAGSKLSGDIRTNSGSYVSLPYAFGYADNVQLNNKNLEGLPDNPYTIGNIEGDGGDAIDISWAIDSESRYVDLPEIDFIMIYTGINESAGWLGEISTDVRGIIDTNPNMDIKGSLKMILPLKLPSKIALSDSMKLSARIFFSGRPAPDEEIFWESMNPSVLLIRDNVIITKSIGETEIKGSLISDPSVFIKGNISVISPENLLFDNKSRMVEEGEQLWIPYSLTDNSGEQIYGLIPQIVTENENIAAVTEINDKGFSVIGELAGVTTISISFTGYPKLTGSFGIEVIRKIDPVNLTFSMSNEEKIILPGKSYRVEKTDFLSFTDRYQQISHPEKPYITLADAIVSVLKSEGFGNEGKSIAFRQDEYGGKGLYVWQIGIDWEYQYGWGGSMVDESHAKTWFAIVNNKLFASGFDTIKINNGDQICLKHIEDNRNPWNFIRIVPEKDKIKLNESVNFRSEQLDFYPKENSDFAVSGPYPVVDQLILVEPSVINSWSDQYTSFNGEFSLSFKQSGFHQLSIENSEPLIVEVLSPLTITDYEQLSVFPNPCNDFITIGFQNIEASVIKLFGTDGNLRIRKAIEAGVFSVNLNLSELKSGIYVLEIISNGIIINHRICKL